MPPRRQLPSALVGVVLAATAIAEGAEAPARILLVRHARSAGDPFATPERPVRGFLADPLGLKQAQAAAEALKRERIDVAISSPYGRALQTAEIVLAGRDVPIHVLPALREWIPNPALKDAPPSRRPASPWSSSPSAATSPTLGWSSGRRTTSRGEGHSACSGAPGVRAPGASRAPRGPPQEVLAVVVSRFKI